MVVAAVTFLMMVWILYCERGICYIDVNKSCSFPFVAFVTLRLLVSLKTHASAEVLEHINPPSPYTVLPETASTLSSHDAFHPTCILVHSCVPLRCHLRGIQVENVMLHTA